MILILLPIALSMIFIFDKKFEETIALAVFFINTILYCSGLITTFVPGIYLVCFVAIISFFFCTFKCLKNWELAKKKIFTSGFAGFIILILYFLAFDYGRYLAGNDDFIHWGIAVKHFYILNDFSDVEFTTDLASRYPPFTPLWCYITTKLWLTCSTGMMFWGEHVMIVSLLAPLFKSISIKRQKSLFFVVLLFSVVFPYWTGPSTDCSFMLLGPDLLICAIVFFILHNFREYTLYGENYYFMLSVYGVFALTLTKQSGIILGLFVCYIITSVNIMQKIPIKKNIIQQLIYVGIIVVAYASWNIYTYTGPLQSGIAIAIMNSLNTRTVILTCFVMVLVLLLFISKTVRQSYITVRSSMPAVFTIAYLFVCLILACGANYDEAGLLAFFKDISVYFFDNINYYVGYIVKVPFYLFLILLFVGTDFFIKNKVNAIDAYIFRAMIIGLILYIIFRIVGHMIFQPDENSVASFGRYIYEYLGAVIIYGFYIICCNISSVHKYMILFLLIITCSNCSKAVSELFDKPQANYFPEISKVDFQYGDNIYLVDTFLDDNRCELDFRYQVTPAMSNDAFEATWYLQNNLSGRRLTVSEVSDLLLNGNYNYVYLNNIDDGFAEYYSDIFSDSGSIQIHHIYRIRRNGELVELSLYE